VLKVRYEILEFGLRT